MLIHVAWVQRVRNEKQGADNECDSCRPFSTSLCPGALHDLPPPALVVWGMAGAFRLLQQVLGVKWRWMLGWVVAGGGST
ncbi:MAG: hypothetical protein IBX40_08965 [Methanosarcinales archaeon]|nr:hypothetical protein [Methanosarcinales archaeon]